MQKNEKAINDALKKLCANNILPQERFSTLTEDINLLKKTLEPMTKKELELLLNNIPQSKIDEIKKQIK